MKTIPIYLDDPYKKEMTSFILDVIPEKEDVYLYQGMIERDIKDELQKKCDELIAKDIRFSWNFELLENIEKEAIYLQPGLPKNKPLRALELDGVGVVVDGGTIVSSTKEVGNITITGIEAVDGNTCIKYQVI